MQVLNSWQIHYMLSTYLIAFILCTINHANIRLGSTCFSKKELTIQIDFLSIKNWVLSVYYTIGIINMATTFFSKRLIPIELRDFDYLQATKVITLKILFR